MQLVAYGAQDIYLTGNPMITYFKVVYRRHTNFAMESIAQTFDGTVGFGSKVSCLISRNGDLVSGMMLEATLPAIAVVDLAGGAAAARWTDDVGHHLISEVVVEIGGQQIDKHYGDWLEIWAQLTVPASHEIGYRELIGQSPRDTLGQPGPMQRRDGAVASKKVYVPLQFWFCRNVGLALPLIALQYHEVKVHITFNELSKLVVYGTAGTFNTATLWVDYIYLDTDERRRFAQVSHEYLIEQLQFTGNHSFGATDTTLSLPLHLNHPVKELIWVGRETALEAVNVNQWSNFTNVQAVPQNHMYVVNQNQQAIGRLPITTSELNGASFKKPATVTKLAVTGTAPDTNIVAITAHGGAVGDIVIFGSLTGGVGLAINVPYYIRTTSHGTDTFTLSLTPFTDAGTQGAVVDITTSYTAVTGHIIKPATFTTGENLCATAKLKLNGHDRFAVRDSAYFNLVQTGKHHTKSPESPGINVYSFALKPEDHQPSGTCNFSRIDNAQLQLTLPTTHRAGNFKVFAINYNVLRIMSGMGGLAYSN